MTSRVYKKVELGINGRTRELSGAESRGRLGSSHEKKFRKKVLPRFYHAVNRSWIGLEVFVSLALFGLRSGDVMDSPFLRSHDWGHMISGMIFIDSHIVSMNILYTLLCTS